MVDHNGFTPLYIVAKIDDVELLELFLPHFSVRAVTAWKVTPLHIATMFGHVENVRLLLLHSADPNANDYKGDTPLDLARIKNNPVMIQLLEEEMARQQPLTASTRPVLSLAAAAPAPTALDAQVDPRQAVIKSAE